MPSYPSTLPILPFLQPVRGSVTLPGSKSITNRALILAALGSKTVLLKGALFSRDTRIMVAALQQLGFNVEADEAALTIRIEGRGGEIPVREASLHVGNAGTAARFLTAFVCLRPDGIYHFDGDEAMRHRPIGALLDALAAQGATASARAFPFTLHTAGLPGGHVLLDASESSQLLSALLMVSSRARKPLHVQLTSNTVSRPFVEMTERMIRQFTAQPSEYAIEGDATAASYFAALAVVADGKVVVKGLHLAADALQGDIQFFRLLSARSLISCSGVQVRRGASRTGLIANFNDFSDTFLSLAAIAPLLSGPTKISGIAHTRKQETDRVAGMARELRKLGQHVVETEDSLEIHPRPLVAGVEIETYHDHRFAMSFAVLGCHNLHGDGRPWLTIKDPACCAKTFPDFFTVLDALRIESARTDRPPSAAPMPLPEPFVIVAIDGGAASGKSSSSRRLAERFHLLHVDTGSFYRHLTAELRRRGVPATDLDALAQAVSALKLSTQVRGRSAEMLVDGVPAGDEIRGAEVNEHVSHYAAVPLVRTALLNYQRGQVEVARQHGFRGLVMEGRDIGSVIFPEADFRFFLHADPAERAKRRAAEGRQDSIAERDRLDSSRKTSPLTCPPGAIDIDSTFQTLDEVVDRMAGLIATKV